MNIKALVTGLLCFCAFAPSCATAGVNAWTPVGPDGGRAYDVEFSQTSPGTFYALGGSGLYRSTVTGDSFELLEDDFGRSAYDFAVDPFSGPGGLYIDNPRYAFESASDTYWQRQGQPPVDYNDGGGANQPHAYRGPLDLPATEFSNGNGQNGGNSISEMMRQKVQDALALNAAIREVNLGFFDGNNWQNYTRTYPAGIYNVYARIADGGGALSATLDLLTSGWGTPIQTTTNLGIFSYNNSGGYLFTSNSFFKELYAQLMLMVANGGIRAAVIYTQNPQTLNWSDCTIEGISLQPE